MYSERLRVLKRAYTTARSNNELYSETQKKAALQRKQVAFLGGMHMELKKLNDAITLKESEWRQAVLTMLEAEIARDLEYVYPTDGYRVQLSPRIARGRIHIDARVVSTFASEIPGKIQGTQGRLFQQVVSFAALRGVMSLLDVKTIYIDEAFSGASKRNVKKLNRLLASLDERGHNLVLIAQDTTMADSLPANRLILTRSLDNKTKVVQEESVRNE